MSIFTKPIAKISFPDIEDFCRQGIKENIRVEYKKEFSSTDPNVQIAKEVVAFANTQGGIILFGVAENGERKPKLPLVGMDKTQKPEDKVKSICLARIYPPVFPEIQTCEVAGDSDKVVLVVRVQQSDETPHTINKKTGLYIRSDDRCVPRRATIEEIEWLQNRRQKAVDNRKRLLQRVKDRCTNIPYQSDFKTTLTISVIPLFPSKPLAGLEDLLKLSKESLIKSGADRIYPRQWDSLKTSHESLFSFVGRRSPAGGELVYNETNIFGLVYHQGSIGLTEEGNSGKEKQKAIDQLSILGKIYLAFKYAGNLYKNLGYWGLLLININLNGVRGTRLRIKVSAGGFEFPEVVGSIPLDDSIPFERKYTVNDLVEKIDDIMVDILREFRWSCDLGDELLSEERLENIIARAKMIIFGKKLCPKCNRYYAVANEDICLPCRRSAKE